MSECTVCNQPLSEDSNLPVHLNCAACIFCHDTIPNEPAILESLTKRNNISHEPCYFRSLAADFKSKDIPLVREHVKFLNSKILHVYDSLSDSDVNDIELLTGLVRDLTECTANVSYALARTKDKLAIKSSADYREHVEYVKTEKSKKQVEKVLDEQARLAEKENPALKARRLAIEGFMKAGLTKDMATSMVDGMKGKAQ